MIGDGESWYWHGPEPPDKPAKDWGRNPYEHLFLLYGNGACDVHCDACAWTRARATRQRTDLGYGYQVAPTRLVDGDHMFLAAAKISWEGDLREEKR